MAIPLPQLDDISTRRFWSHVDIQTPLECWHWKRGKGFDGYGKFAYKGSTLRAHRVSYFLHYGVDPLDLLVCHRCDNPRCCNPYHLFLGTASDNVQDAVDKGRLTYSTGDEHWSRAHPEYHPRGEQVGGAKLTSEDVIEIRRLYAIEQLSQPDIAQRFGVTRECVSGIIRGRTWTHLNSELPVKLSDPKRHGKVGSRNNSAKLTEETVKEIRRLYAGGGETLCSLAAKFGVSQAAVGHVIVRRSWKHVE